MNVTELSVCFLFTVSLQVVKLLVLLLFKTLGLRLRNCVVLQMVLPCILISIKS